MPRWDGELGDLVARRGRALNGYAYLLCGDAQQAEDLVQDALVKVFSRLRRPPSARPGTVRTVDLGVDPPGRAAAPDVASTEGYVRSTILTLYLDGYRRRRRWTGVRHLVATDDAVRGPEAAASARADVAAALAGLTPRQRACVVLRYFEDLTVPQVAAALGSAEGTVKRHLHDAMAVMHATLHDDHAGTRPAPRPGGRRAR
ncbi:RNA polymerase sigma factor [Cellulosimicrobium protaetiae]|uniref:RNA polymerase subunit sigma-24 n=1 Tax=Cellulosimicrobium protaetiae TaxID=2587808 RepID=A0A6M5UGS0_9MICO|nr:sigma factor-like helix-turn-helix DNA-binding protein [Cellulosimicrobium protaetiae]QJW37817.1 RNA polymerase subunit sigma-24 [Cellulosimicrobium protaetiae]